WATSRIHLPLSFIQCRFSGGNAMNPQELRKHIESTYNSLRLGMGIIALVFPIALWLGGYWLSQLSLQSSISAYYHTPMRDLFVGTLFAVGSFLYLYKGFSAAENYALNLAGIFAVGAAVFPLAAPPTAKCEVFTAGYAHGICTVLFFVCIAYVC